MKFFKLKIPRVVYLDSLVVGAILLGLNCLLAPADIGWLKRNPSPYLLLPILIGSRFGFLGGICAGAFAGLIIGIGQVCFRSVDLLVFLHSEAFFLTFVILIGGICGEVQEVFHEEIRQLSALHETLRNRLKKVDNELYFLKETKSELDRIIATRDTELCTLDTEIRELHSAKSQELYPNILRLLNRRAHITDAAIYSPDQDGQFVRQALVGSEKDLPANLSPTEIEMVALALERKTAVTIPEFWNRQPEQHHNYLIALPLLDFDEHPLALLIVTGMPFFAFNQKTVHLVSVIGKWAAKVLQFKNKAADRFRLVDGVEHQQVFTERILKQNIELCFNSYEQYNLPSALAFFALPNMPCSFQDSFERLIIPIVRAGDCPAELNLGFPNLAVLLALTPERSAQVFMDRVADNCRRELSLANSLERRLFTFDQMENSDQLWEELRSYAKANVGAVG